VFYAIQINNKLIKVFRIRGRMFLKKIIQNSIQTLLFDYIYSNTLQDSKKDKNYYQCVARLLDEL